jgi:DNA-binding FrmR family transcriptional regulator
MPQRIDDTGNPDSKIQDEAIIRLKRIEGQVRGLSKLIQSEAYNENILNQFASVKSALNSTRNLLLKGYIRNDMPDKLIKDRLQSTEELIDIFKKITT